MKRQRIGFPSMEKHQKEVLDSARKEISLRAESIESLTDGINSFDIDDICDIVTDLSHRVDKAYLLTSDDLEELMLEIQDMYAYLARNNDDLASLMECLSVSSMRPFLMEQFKQELMNMMHTLSKMYGVDKPCDALCRTKMRRISVSKTDGL